MAANVGNVDIVRQFLSAKPNTKIRDKVSNACFKFKYEMYNINIYGLTDTVSTDSIRCCKECSGQKGDFEVGTYTYIQQTVEHEYMYQM